jgi:hypothetical protein
MNRTDEDQLRRALDHHDELVRHCLSGALPFNDFVDAYGSFWDEYALDGHESDTAHRQLLVSLEVRIALHREIAEQVMSRLCSDADATDSRFIQAGRYGSAVAFQRLAIVAKRFSL